jgi:DNA-binding transcriptional regulator LsrR (DeoR family)
MSSKRERESMERMDKVYKVVQQSSTKGINAAEIAKKIGIHRSTVHRNLVSLELMGKVENTGGMWRAKTGEQRIKPLEKEIEIVLPMPRNKWADAARLQVHADYADEVGFHGIAKMEKTILEKFDETRTIRIRGKNVDDIDLEKIGKLIEQASEKSYKFSFKGLFKGLRKSLPDITTTNREKTTNTERE